MSKKDITKNFFEAPSEIKAMIVSGHFGYLSWSRYSNIVLKYPNWFDEDEVKRIQKLKTK